MQKYVLNFKEIDKTCLPFVGGKGANLGEMTKAGFPVPQGFCVSTCAYKTFIQKSKEMDKFFDQLEEINSEDLKQISRLAENIRNHIKSIHIPDDIRLDILNAWEASGKDKAYAVRSSATAEDLPTASFAGQQDTYLNIRGSEQLLSAIQDCWASLFTDRAISYRAKNRFDHRSVLLSVVVQQMVFPDVSGIMFTADPISGRRKTVSIDASFGLGEALVSGLVTADLYQVSSGKIIKKKISKKKMAIYSLLEGGTTMKDIPSEKQELQALPDERIIELSQLGRQIEAHYNSEQDIEWGLADGRFYILQSRPITSLYPLPPVKDDSFHVFASFGHIQMMTDAMKPLAISVFKNIPNYIIGDSSNDNNFILSAGGRAFADFTEALRLKPSRHILLKVLNSMDELLVAAISEVIRREKFRSLPVQKRKVFKVIRKMAPLILPTFVNIFCNLLFRDPSMAKDKAESFIEKTVIENEKLVFEVSGAERIRRIKQKIEDILPNVLPKVMVYWIAGVLAAGTLKNKLYKQVGEKQGAYLLSRLNKSLPGNVVTELGMELGDLADTARKYPEVIAYLQKADKRNFYKGLSGVPGGLEFKLQFESFLKKYGMRCAAEIDISKPRWNEDPTQLLPSIISNIRTSEPGEHRKKFKQGELDATQAEKEILSKFEFYKRSRITRLIKLYRNLMGMREHHKFVVVKLFDIYKRAIMEEAHLLAGKRVLQNEQDVFYLSLEELIELEENRFAGDVKGFIEARKQRHELDQKLSPPRVMTSDGEIITGKLRDVEVPEGALVGIPVSSGVVEGFARVIHRLEDAKLNPGEILVAPYTDPGWTPLFTSAVGLVTEIGGMMTHGSVVAREYGIPAVVGIEKATEIIKDGARIRINGTDGFVEIL